MGLNDIFTFENIQTIGIILGTLAFGVFVAIKTFKKCVAKYLNSDGVSGKIKAQTNINLMIIKKMEETKEILNADRIQIFEFHNGGHYANGRSAHKTSCTYEICRCGVQPYQTQLLDIPLNCIINFTSALLDNEKLSITDIEQIKTTMPATYGLKRNMGIKSFFDMIIKNKKGEPVGFIAIQFCTNKYNINEEVVQKLAWFVEERLISIMA